MATQAELVNAAATVLIVAGAHARTWTVARRRHNKLEARLRSCSEKLDELRDVMARWSGLP